MEWIPLDSLPRNSRRPPQAFAIPRRFADREPMLPPAPEVAHDLKTNPPLRSVRWLSAIVFSAPLACGAHTFGTVYNLPVPFWMYAYGASAALIVSFAIVAYFARVPMADAAAQGAGDRAITGKVRVGGRWLLPLRVVSVSTLALAIVAGFGG